MDDINRTIWKIIFRLFDPVSDNVWLVIGLTAFLFSGIMLFVRWKLKIRTYVFLLPEWIVTISTAYMIHRLPMVHERLQLALSTVSGIILESSTYQEAFQSVTGLANLTGERIASCLYFASEPFYPEPTVMYEHLFGTLDQIRKAPVLGEIHEACFGIVTPLFIACIGFIILAGIFTCLKGGTRFRFLVFLAQAAFLLACTFFYNGAAFCALILWASEFLISEAHFFSNTSEK